MSKIPGQRTGNTATPRVIKRGPGPHTVLPGPVVIDATYAIDGANTNRTDELRAGCLMGKISSGLWVPLKLTRIATGGSGSGSGKTSTLLPVDDARFFKVGDPIIVDTGTASTPNSGTTGALHTSITAINYTTNILTLNDSVDDTGIGAKVTGRGAIAGSHICRGILLETVRLRSKQPYELATDLFDTQAQILVGGMVDRSQILGDLAAVLADRTNHYGIAQVQFDEELGKA